MKDGLAGQVTTESTQSDTEVRHRSHRLVSSVSLSVLIFNSVFHVNRVMLQTVQYGEGFPSVDSTLLCRRGMNVTMLIEISS